AFRSATTHGPACFGAVFASGRQWARQLLTMDDRVTGILDRRAETGRLLVVAEVSKGDEQAPAMSSRCGSNSTASGARSSSASGSPRWTRAAASGNGWWKRPATYNSARQRVGGNACTPPGQSFEFGHVVGGEDRHLAAALLAERTQPVPVVQARGAVEFHHPLVE